jgi:hypothetical protein
MAIADREAEKKLIKAAKPTSLSHGPWHLFSSSAIGERLSNPGCESGLGTRGKRIFGSRGDEFGLPGLVELGRRRPEERGRHR